MVPNLFIILLEMFLFFEIFFLIFHFLALSEIFQMLRKVKEFYNESTKILSASSGEQGCKLKKSTKIASKSLSNKKKKFKKNPKIFKKN